MVHKLPNYSDSDGPISPVSYLLSPQTPAVIPDCVQLDTSATPNPLLIIDPSSSLMCISFMTFYVDVTDGINTIRTMFAIIINLAPTINPAIGNHISTSYTTHIG